MANRLDLPPNNSLYYSVPTPAPAPQVDPRLSMRQRLENLSAGLGYGLTGQLEDIKALATDPVGYGQNVLRSLRAVARQPSILGNALRESARRAASGPLGAGEVAGGLLPLRPGGQAPDMLNIKGKFPTISTERIKAMREQIRQQFRDKQISMSELLQRNRALDDMEWQNNYAEQVKTAKGAASPVFENIPHIPVGTKVKFQRGFNQDIREGVVVGTHVLQSKTAGTARAPIVRIPDGTEIRLAPHNIKEVYMPRAVSTPDAD